MQPAGAGRRLLSTLSARLHPQLPLSPRESQQLLTLLTTSFRAHLDREHAPSSASEHVTGTPRRSSASNARRIFPTHAPTSHAAATQHIDSILTNPLLAVKPRRRGSESAAVEVLKDPMGWFINEIATGTASLPKAVMCLEILSRTTEKTFLKLPDGKRPAIVIAKWLQDSGLDTSKQFVELCVGHTGRATGFLNNLVACLLAENERSVQWRWFIRPDHQRAKETGLDAVKIASFRRSLLAKMVAVETKTSLDRGITTFMQAFRMSVTLGHEAGYALLRPAGASIVRHISSGSPVEPALYQAFLASIERWIGCAWSEAVRTMLWLHHPSRPSALAGLKFLQDPTGAITFVHSSRSRRHFLVQLCLGVAHQLLEQKKHIEALVAMNFAKEHFPDIVLSEALPVSEKSVTAEWRARREQENLELLNSLVPA
ncbi:hypothetical protein ACN47E_005312 [Coniothyrium glycines]